MNKLHKFLIALVATMFISGTAYAGAGTQGFSIGVVGNAATFDTTGAERETQCSEGAAAICFMEDPNTATFSKDVDFPSFFIEYTVGEGQGGGVTLGVEVVPGDAEIGAKSRTDTVSDANETSTDTGTYSAKAEVEDMATVYIEPTYMISDWFGLYGTAGVSTVQVNSLESIAIGTDSSSYGNKRILGGMYGVGVKMAHSSGLFVKIDGRKTVYQEITLQSSTGNKNEITASPESEAVRLAIGFNF